jgi:hypothetical protein
MEKCFHLFLILTLILFFHCGKEDPKPEVPVIDSTAQRLPTQYQPLIGLEFGPDSFPAGFEEHTGYVMGFIEGDEYIIDHVSQGSTELVWFCKLTHRDEEGRPFLKILDALILPQFNPNEQLYLGACSYKDMEDPEIVAIIKTIQNELETEVVKAWRANRQTKIFEEISSEHVVCVDESIYL